MSTSNHYNNRSKINESLSYKDLDGLMKPTLHIDEFSSKMGDDADIIVVSFFLRDRQAAKDLTNWFEKGYDFILDADQSPGEIRPNRYLVYIEMRRRMSAPEQINDLIGDLGTLTEFDVDDWRMVYENKTYPWSIENMTRVVPLSPKEYRERKERDLNEWRTAAGLQTKPTYERDAAIQTIQSAAGII